MSLIQNLCGAGRRAFHLGGTASVLAFVLAACNLPTLAQSESSESQAAESHASESAIEGSWILTIDRINQGGKTFTAMMSFTGGGVALATGSADRLPPPPISPLYGSWKRTGPNRAVATLNFFLFDLLGNPVGMLKNHESFHLKSPNELEGSGVALFCGVDGENCVSAVGSEIAITGHRIIPEGVPE